MKEEVVENEFQEDVIKLDLKEDEENLKEKVGIEKTSGSLFRYFNVDDIEIQKRLKYILRVNDSSLITELKSDPDLYIPIWGAALLVCILYISFSISELIEGKKSSITLLMRSSTLIYGYSFFAPICLFLAAKLNSFSIDFSLNFSLIGHSLLFYVPSAFLSKIPMLGWLTLLGSCLVSVLFLYNSYKRLIK